MSGAIGIFDSGLGGLTVAAAIASALPDEPLIYLGDTARVPYGTRSPATVVRYARNNVRFLQKHGVKMVVVACNTVSAQGLGGLADGSTIPILGVIRPSARAAVAASQGGEIAVLGTQATIRSGAYLQAIHELDPARQIHGIPCPLFVPLVEEGWLNHPVTEQVAHIYLSALQGTAVDTIILGCTHYPLLREIIESTAQTILNRHITIIDSASAVADDVTMLLDKSGLRHASADADHTFYVTDIPEHAQVTAARFWGRTVGGATLKMQHVDLMGTP